MSQGNTNDNYDDYGDYSEDDHDNDNEWGFKSH